jgi:hypothetical protein
MTRIAVPNSAGRRRSSGGAVRWVVILLVGVIVVCGLWSWLTLSWAYADGDRAGVLQRFVRRGWLCKTQEGEIALYYGGGQYMGASTSPQLWDFSVRDKTVAAQLIQAVGHRVQLHYTEHPGIPTACFAETKYFVDKVTITDQEPKAGAAPGAAGAAAAPAAQGGSDAQAGATLPAPPPPLPADQKP